jgi:hypothetical protein
MKLLTAPFKSGFWHRQNCGNIIPRRCMQAQKGRVLSPRPFSPIILVMS